jgi:hypothetical protein
MDAKAFQVRLSRQSYELLTKFHRKNAGQSWQKYIARSWQQQGVVHNFEGKCSTFL